jgi:mycothiol synthase
MVITKIQTELRPFTFDDAQAVVDLINACSQKLHGWNSAELDDLMNDWTSPGIQVGDTVRVVENSLGEIIGYIDIWDNTNPHVTKYVWGILHPDNWNNKLYSEMLSWAKNCCQARIKLAPEGTRIIMSQGVANKDILRKASLESFGFDLARHFYQMQIELDQAPKLPVVPEGLTVMKIDMESDLEEAILANEEAFKDHWGYVERPAEEVLVQWQHHLENNKDFDPTLWFLAKDGDRIAGMCRCASKTVEDPEMGWVNALSVRKPWRRRGLGMTLLLTAFNEFYQRGKQRAGLAVDALSLTNATKLYEKAGMHVTLQYDTYEMELRPGIDLKKV